MELWAPPACGFVEIIAEVIFFLFKVGDSMLEPTVRLFIYDSVCKVEFPNDTTCYHLPSLPEREGNVQKVSAKYLMYYKILVNLPAILLGLFCGAWSDRVGRKLPVMLSCLGTILAVIFYMLSMVVNGSVPSLPCVLAGAVIRGAFGKSAVITMALHSYISDISTTEARTRKLGKLLSMNYFGYFVGSLTAGALLEVASFDVIFCIVVFVNSLCILLTLVFMRESVPDVTDPDVDDTEARKSEPSKRGPFHPIHVRESLQVLLRSRQDRVRCHILSLFFVIMIHQMCKAGEVDVTLLFVERAPLRWERQTYGFLLATDYACLGLAVFALMPAIIWCIKSHDLQIVIVGVSFKVLRLVLLAFSKDTTMVYLAMVFGCPSAMIISGTKSLISKSVQENEIGKTFSLLSCGEAASNLLGSVVFTSVYSSLLHLFPGFIFLLDAILYVFLFVLLILLMLDMRTTSQYRLLQNLVNKPTAMYGALETPTEERAIGTDENGFAKSDVMRQGLRETSEALQADLTQDLNNKLVNRVDGRNPDFFTNGTLSLVETRAGERSKCGPIKEEDEHESEQGTQHEHESEQGTQHKPPSEAGGIKADSTADIGRLETEGQPLPSAADVTCELDQDRSESEPEGPVALPATD